LYSEDEVRALDWGASHLQNTELWVGIAERLWEAYMITHNNTIPRGNYLRTHWYDPRYQYVYVSAREQLRAERTGYRMPALFGWLRVYDNGNMQLYHLPTPVPK
jgi:hypothetical protein